jgi:hypothetical protein
MTSDTFSITAKHLISFAGMTGCRSPVAFATKKKRKRKEKDFGGCRCQAYLLSGDAAAADPVCSKSPNQQLVQDAIAAARTAQATSGVKEHPIVFRTDKNSRELTNVTKVT